MKGRFYYSEKQKATALETAETLSIPFRYGAMAVRKPKRRNFCKLKDGRVVEYTEWISKRSGTCNWDDAVFLGYGEYSHSESL